MFNHQEMREKVLNWIARPQYAPVKPSTLAQQLGLLKEDFKEFQKLIRRMRKEGQLMHGTNHMVLPIKPIPEPVFRCKKKAKKFDDGFESGFERGFEDGFEDARWPEEQEAPEGGALDLQELQDSGLVVGYFSRHPDGFGFVSEQLLNASAENIDDDDEDIYIPARWTKDASTGDYVAVKLDDVPRRGRYGDRRRRSGTIERILERAKTSFVGTFREKNGVGYVQVDGRVFTGWIRVGDATANRVINGDKVTLELTRYPRAGREGEGVILEILGPRGDLKTETLAVMRQYDLPERFEDPVLAEANKQVELFRDWEAAGGEIPEGREDLTQLYIITIDPADARDFDDAISIEPLPNGNMRLGVHIADVSHFVQPSTRMDGEAFDRGNSTYLPDKVIPMLPEVLSNGLASLQPDQPRFVKSVFQDFTPAGQPLDTRLCDAVIKSRYRLNYEEVDRFFNGDEKELPQEVRDALRKFRDLAQRLRERRHSQGMLSMNLPEIRLELDKEGNVIGLSRESNTESHQMIEEFMVCANEAVARTLAEKEAILMRRIHKAPQLTKLDALAQFLEELGIRMDGSGDRFELQRILENAVGTPNEFAVHQAVLRAMQRAEYSPETEGHYALASDCYCHFTSPIRRYSDLTVHRQVEKLLQGVSPNREYHKVYNEGKHLSFCERNSESAERELVRVKLLYFLREKGELEMDAQIVGVMRFGLYVRCRQYPLDGMVPLEGLPPDKYRFNARGQVLEGFREGNSFRLGDAVRVQVAKLDTDSRDIQFRIAGVEEKKHRRRNSVTDPRESDAVTFEDVVAKRKQNRRPKK